MNFLSISKLVIALSVLLSSAAFAQQKRSGFAVQDSVRRKALQASAQEWFERDYLPKVRQVLNPIDSYGVSVIEPRSVLPPDLGGPLNYVQVTIEARISGWNYSHYRSHGSFSHFPSPGFAECRLQQKVWAHINAQGYPTKLMKGQTSSGLVACGSSGFFPPEYHGIQRPRF